MFGRSADVHVRVATVEDLPGIERLQREIYSQEHVESADVYGAILQQGLSVVAAVDGDPIGFLLLRRVPSESSFPALHDAIRDCGARARALYVHDLTVDPRWRFRDVGSRLVEAAVDLAAEQHPFVPLNLLAVNGTQPFWRKNGFTLACDVHLAPEVMASYNSPPVPMRCVLTWPFESE